eukprot:365278-Chlamydomonas_euryale.AAC.14
MAAFSLDFRGDKHTRQHAVTCVRPLEISSAACTNDGVHTPHPHVWNEGPRPQDWGLSNEEFAGCSYEPPPRLVLHGTPHVLARFLETPTMKECKPLEATSKSAMNTPGAPSASILIVLHTVHTYPPPRTCSQAHLYGQAWSKGGARLPASARAALEALFHAAQSAEHGVGGRGASMLNGAAPVETATAGVLMGGLSLRRPVRAGPWCNAPTTTTTTTNICHSACAQPRIVSTRTPAPWSAAVRLATRAPISLMPAFGTVRHRRP